MQEKTTVIVKPDGVYDGLVEPIKAIYARTHLKLTEELRLRLTIAEAEELYQDHQGKRFFSGLVLSMSSGDIVAWRFEGNFAISQARELNGEYKADPSDYPEGTIRGDFKGAGGPFNRVHSSDSTAEADREWNLLRKAARK